MIRDVILFLKEGLAVSLVDNYLRLETILLNLFNITNQSKIHHVEN